jgi:integrase/recombinase XerD
MDPARGYIAPAFKIEMIKGQEEPLKLFTDEELELLLEKPRAKDSFTDWRTWAIVNWVIGTGNRAATICQVQIGDIDFKYKEITLQHTKNKKAQTIPLSPALETVIKEYIRIWRKESSAEDYLFPSVADEKLTTNALAHSFGRYCNDRGVERTNIHGLRHNFAKGWVRNNGNMFALQQILGHSSLDMTRRYVKLFGEDIKEDFEKFNPLDNIKRAGKRTHNVKRSY